MNHDHEAALIQHRLDTVTARMRRDRELGRGYARDDARRVRVYACELAHHAVAILPGGHAPELWWKRTA